MPMVRAALLGCAALLTIGAAPNWNTQVAKTDGGHRLGNPDAKVQLIAFESYTCPTCGRFEKEASGALKAGYVHSGKVSLEIRHVIRDPVDMTAALLTNCGATSKFFGNHTAIFLSQDRWLPKVHGASQAQRNRWFTGDNSARRRAIAADVGFYSIMENRGYRRTDLDKCLNDEAKARKLAETTAADDEKYDISGTPSFALNGLLLFGTHGWNLLQPQIDARL